MSATPQPNWTTILSALEACLDHGPYPMDGCVMCTHRIYVLGAVRRVLAPVFAALLTVAKAADKVDESYQVEDELTKLDAAFPGWRDWSTE